MYEVKQLNGAQKQQRRRAARIVFWGFIYLIVVSSECLIVGGIVSIGRNPGILDILLYQVIIPIVGGFSVIIGLISRKLKPDLYDEYGVTSLITIENQARKFVELYNKFADEQDNPERLELVKKK